MSSDAASRRIGAFIQRFGPAHLALACHAAFPLALTPDLLYRLWAHFQLDAQGAPLRVPWVAVADLLLSGMCREVGHELFELEPAVRAALLRELRDSPRFGQARIAELGRFLLDYVGQLLLSDSPDERDFAESQQWTALAYVRPDEAMRRLAQAARRAAGASHAERVRVRALVETLEAPLSEHAEFAALLAGVRAKTQPAQAPQPAKGAPRRKANPRPIKVPRATKPPTQATPEQSDAAPLCVLAIIPAPTNLDEREWARVDAEREWADIRSNLAELDPALFALDRLEPPTPERLRSQLAQADYDVVHFVGHIAIDQDNASWDVTLQDEQGRASNMDGQEFTALLARHAALRLVVLNVAQLDPELDNDLFLRAVQIALREPVAAVLLVPPGARDATRAFNHALYTALAAQNPIEAALEAANHAARQTRTAWAEPTLFSRAPDGSVTSTSPADADDDQTPQLLAQRDQLRRRLQQLERQRALYGIDLPVRIVADIQDTQHALAAIEAQLAGTPPPEQKTVFADEITQALLTQVDHQRRRLRALEQQDAYYGVNAPAHIIAEIDEARRELDHIYSQLRATGLPVADDLDALDADGIEHLQLLRLTKLRRLRIRERQKAALGDQAEAVIITEMSDLHTEIAQIEQRLRNANVTPIDPPNHPPKPDPAPTTPGPLADEERAQLAELRYTTQRRLQEREKQHAAIGDTSARPEILMEIEDLQARLQILDSQLGQAPPTAESLAHTQEIRKIKLRRLREIERMVAQFGSQAPKHLVDENNTLRIEVAQIEQQLVDIGVALADSNAIPTPTPAPEQPAAPTLDPEERAPLEAQYHMIERRLKILERQQARLGYDTPPEVSTEIEDLRRRLAALAGRLGGPPPPPAPRPQPAPADPEHRPLIEAQRELEIERLRALEVQRARYGEARVPPEIVIQIEDLREDIDYLDRQLGIAAEAPDETGQRAALEQLRAIRMERLRVLETQQARYSAELAPASMLVEIEDLRNEIADLDLALSATQLAPNNPPQPNTISVTTRWGTLRLSAALDGLALGALLRAGQVYQVRIAAQLAPSEIAQVHSQASVGEQALELRLAISTKTNRLFIELPGMAALDVEAEDAVGIGQFEQPVLLETGAPPEHVKFDIRPMRAGQALLEINASADGTLLAQLQLSFTVEDVPLAEQQAQPQTNAPATPAQAPDEPALERSSEIDVSIALHRGSQQLRPGPDRTYTLALSEQYALQVSVQLTGSLTEDSIAMNLGELPLHRRIVVQAQNLIVEGEHQRQVSFAIGGPWATADFILRPLAAGAAAVLVSTYDRENLEDQQRLSFEVLAAPPTQA